MRISEGLGNAAIAHELILSVRTVENHVQSAFRKTGVNGRGQLGLALRTWLRDDAREA